jgi:hypothetical protein
LQSQGAASLKALVERYRDFYVSQKKYFTDILHSGVYKEVDGLTIPPPEVVIDGKLHEYLEERVEFWETCKVELQNFCVSMQGKNGKEVYEGIAERTIILMAVYCPKIFGTVCDSLRHTDFTNKETPHVINIFELQCREWPLVYLFVSGANLGGDYVHILQYILLV